jgi:autotransporter-associated beta strand protein
LNAQWFYNWNLNQNSSRDLEYVAIRQTRYWPGLDQNWQSRGINTLLGYNEPDNPDQDAYMSVGDAVYSWPDLLGTGLRVGAPAVTDGGRDGWLYPFMDQTDAANLRVDFVAIHYYQCHNPADPSGAATQMYNFLKATYDRVKRPLWITEWNNGANWTTCGDPTYAQQKAAIAAMTEMLDTTPFVERYAAYNWVEDVRRLRWDDGSLTDAGVVYRDKVSPIGYRQALPDNQTRGVAQLRFENETLDSSGFGNNGMSAVPPVFTNGHNGQALAFDGANSYVTLPPNIARSNAFSFAAWVCWNGGGNWQRIFDFGNDTSHYFFLTPRSGDGTLRFAIRNGGSEQIVQFAALPMNQWVHVAVTLSGNTARLYTNGALVAVNSAITIAPSNVDPAWNYLGKSQFNDPLFQGLIDEVQIADYAFSSSQIAAMITNTPPQFVTNLITGLSATQNIAFNYSLGSVASDPDAGDTLTFSKVGGPAWLNLAADGTMTGMPSSDGGTNLFVVRVTDSAGASAFAVMAINTLLFNANGTWNADADGFWGDTNNWSGHVIASGAGFTADFSTLNISEDRIVTLDSPRTIGALKFGDVSGTESWTISANDGNALTLDSGGTVAPSVSVFQNTATISAPLAGSKGLTKSGNGTLALAGNNLFTGTTTIASGTLAISEAGRLSNGAHDGNIMTFGTLRYDSSASQILSGVISGTGGLIQNSGALTLSANNTFTGGTIVRGGVLNLAKGGGTGAIRNNLTIQSPGVVNLTAGDALGYSAGSPAVFVTVANLVGGSLNIATDGNEAYRTAFYLTGGAMTSSGGGSFHFDGTAGGSINSLSSPTISTISAKITLRGDGVVISTAKGSTSHGIDLNITGAIGEQYGSFGFSKSGPGTLLLSAASTYSGSTMIKGGTLLVNGSIGGGAVTVANSATLGGTGTINGSTTVQFGATLSPGAAASFPATMKVNNSVALQPGSFTRMRISKTALTNDVVQISGGSVLQFGGILTVTNIAGVVTVGDRFKLFSAPTYSGTFSGITPPTPGPGLRWDTNQLAMNGTLVVALGDVEPQIETAAFDEAGLHCHGFGGAAGTGFSILSTADLSAPMESWTIEGAGVFDQDGRFDFTIQPASDAPQQFFTIKIP